MEAHRCSRSKELISSHPPENPGSPLENPLLGGAEGVAVGVGPSASLNPPLHPPYTLPAEGNNFLKAPLKAAWAPLKIAPVLAAGA